MLKYLPKDDIKITFPYVVDTNFCDTYSKKDSFNNLSKVMP